MTSSVGPDLQVMLSNLLPADCARLQAFLRVGSDRLRKRWTIGTGGQVGLLLFSGEAPETIPGLLDTSPRLVRVVDHDERHPVDEPVLRRPIDFESFVALMVAAEEALQGRGPSGPAPMPASTPPTPPRPAQPSLPPQAGRPPASGQAATPRAAPMQAAARQPVALDDRVRLRRWPQASLLQNWRYGIRMSSFMSTRFVTVRELAKLSNVGEVETARFVDALHAAGLVRLGDDVGARAPALDRQSAAAPAIEAPTPPPAATARLGLLARLRQKLGLGQRDTQP